VRRSKSLGWMIRWRRNRREATTMPGSELISKKTRTEFREFLVGFTLREISDEFDSAGLQADTAHTPQIGGHRANYTHEELARLVSVTALGRVKDSLRRLEHARLVTWSTNSVSITHPGPPVGTPDGPRDGSPTVALAAMVENLIPFVHVASVDGSLGFYALLGFSPESQMKDPAGRSFWAMARSQGAEIMFALASGPIAPAEQAVLFYMYSADVGLLRSHLLASGLHDGGRYCGQQGPNGGRRVVFEISRPDYMPGGELRISDPDGYCVLVGQLR
jgi:hypothetical protein